MSGLIPRGSGLLGAGLATPVRPRVFISYHHANDQWYYNEFSRLFHDSYEAIEDRSLERQYDSDDLDYVRWAVANDHIKGTSCTIVLCGAETHLRKFVDWEIKATLDNQHGLIGIQLPNAVVNTSNQVIVPERFASNYHSGYAIWGQWTNLSVENLRAWITGARHNATNRTEQIVNPREIRRRNG